MERKVIIALLIGAALGAASASALTTSTYSAKSALPDAPWSAAHAAIPSDAQPGEPAPTF
jgi:hypothetical protein